MDQLAEAKALRQRGGTGGADEEADELGSKARLCFRRILDCLVQLQLLLAATAAGGGASSGYRLVTPSMVPVFVLVQTVFEKVPS